MATDDDFRLGPGLFGVASSSVDQPQQDHAQLWRPALISQHLSAAQRAALFGAPEQCFSHVLQSAPHATIDITLLLQSDAAADPAATVQELQLAAKALATRGHLLPTKVVLNRQSGAGQHADADSDSWRWQAPDNASSPLALSLAQEHLFLAAGQHIQHLQLSWGFLNLLTSEEATSQFLSSTSAALPNLQKLHLESIQWPLPPGLFPQLTDLVAEIDTAGSESCSSSLAPYLLQLRVLTVLGGYLPMESDNRRNIPWSAIFTPSSTSHTLQQFHTHSDLDDTLLSLLLKHAPGLQQLSAAAVHLESDHSASQWGVRELNLQTVEALEALSPLPTHRDGQRVVIAGGQWICWPSVTLSTQGVSSTLLQSLDTNLLVNNAALQLRCPRHLPPSDHPPAVCTALRQLASIQPPPTPMKVNLNTSDFDQAAQEYRDWTADMLQPVLATVSELPQLHASLSIRTLNDALLDALMQHGSGIRDVTARKLQLQDTCYSNTVRPWALQTEDIVSVPSLLCIPPRSRDGCTPEDGVSGLVLDLLPEQVQSGVVDAVTARMQHCRIVNAKPISITIAAPAGLPTADQPAVLRANLQLLREMRLINSEGQPHSTVNLANWTLTPAVIAELASLPQWRGKLCFQRSVVWPEDTAPEAYRQLGSVVPVTYGNWVIHSQYTAEQLVEVCLGVRDARQGLGLGPLELVVSDITQEQEDAVAAEQDLEHAVRLAFWE